MAGGPWPYWHDEIGAHFAEEMSESDALLLGRKTWQIHGGAFEPMAEGDPFGDVMNGMPKYVVSTTLTSATAWRNSTLISGNVVEEVRALKAQPGKNILIDGSSVLIHTLAQNDLIDEYHLLVYPVVAGWRQEGVPGWGAAQPAARRGPASPLRGRADALYGGAARLATLSGRSVGVSARQPSPPSPRPAGRWRCACWTHAPRLSPRAPAL